MTLMLNFIGLLVALVVGFAAAGMETALYRASRVRMRIRADRGEARAKLMLRVLDHIDDMVTTILLDSNIAAYAATYFVTIELVAWKVPQTELVATAVITPLFFILTESLPKQLAYNSADRFALRFVRLFDWSRRVFTPFVWLLNRTSAVLRRLLRSDRGTSFSQSQRTLLVEHFNAGVAEQVLTEEQNWMAVRIMQLEGIDAGDCMVPLRRIVLLKAGSSRAKALAVLGRKGEEIALLVDGAGRVTSRAISRADLVLAEGSMEESVDGIAQTLAHIRRGVAIPEVLNLFREKHARRALVMQGGRVVGVITTKSVLDRIAGIE